MSDKEFYDTLEIEKATASMRQKPLNEVLSNPTDIPQNRALSWMKSILEETELEQLERLCRLGNTNTEGIPWDELTEQELWFLLKDRPDFVRECPSRILNSLSPEIWFSLLLDFPLLAGRCPHIRQFSEKEWRLLVTKYPQLSHRRPHPDCW